MRERKRSDAMGKIVVVVVVVVVVVFLNKTQIYSKAPRLLISNVMRRTNYDLHKFNASIRVLVTPTAATAREQ